jgi:hypothetical protein
MYFDNLARLLLLLLIMIFRSALSVFVVFIVFAFASAPLTHADPNDKQIELGQKVNPKDAEVIKKLEDQLALVRKKQNELKSLEAGMNFQKDTGIASIAAMACAAASFELYIKSKKTDFGILAKDFGARGCGITAVITGAISLMSSPKDDIKKQIQDAQKQLEQEQKTLVTMLLKDPRSADGNPIKPQISGGAPAPVAASAMAN